jgi:uncharacterized protein DUF4167
MNDTRRNGRPQRARAIMRTNSTPRQRHNGPSGNAHRNYERYVALAREATVNGDTIEAENYYQHAEHYFRMMRERSM